MLGTEARSEEETRRIARNQYQAILDRMSREEVIRIAKEEHHLKMVSLNPKITIIKMILDTKYGKET